jgi:hypothetical protein
MRGEMKNVYLTISQSGNFKRVDQLGEQRIDGRIILESFLAKWDVMLRTVLK